MSALLAAQLPHSGLISTASLTYVPVYRDRYPIDVIFSHRMSTSSSHLLDPHNSTQKRSSRVSWTQTIVITSGLPESAERRIRSSSAVSLAGGRRGAASKSISCSHSNPDCGSLGSSHATPTFSKASQASQLRRSLISSSSRCRDGGTIEPHVVRTSMPKCEQIYPMSAPFWTRPW